MSEPPIRSSSLCTGADQSLQWRDPDPASVEGTESERLAGVRIVSMILAERIRRFVLIADRPAAGVA